MCDAALDANRRPDSLHIRINAGSVGLQEIRRVLVFGNTVICGNEHAQVLS